MGDSELAEEIVKRREGVLRALAGMPENLPPPGLLNGVVLPSNPVEVGVEEARRELWGYVYHATDYTAANFSLSLGKFERAIESRSMSRLSALRALADEWERMTWGPYSNPAAALRAVLEEK